MNINLRTGWRFMFLLLCFISHTAFCQTKSNSNNPCTYYVSVTILDSIPLSDFDKIDKLLDWDFNCLESESHLYNPLESELYNPVRLYFNQFGKIDSVQVFSQLKSLTNTGFYSNLIIKLKEVKLAPIVGILNNKPNCYYIDFVIYGSFANFDFIQKNLVVYYKRSANTKRLLYRYTSEDDITLIDFTDLFNYKALVFNVSQGTVQKAEPQSSNGTRESDQSGTDIEDYPNKQNKKTNIFEYKLVTDDDIILPPDSLAEEAKFVGGEKAFNKFISDSFKYPERCINEGINARVELQFVVYKNGDINQILVVKGSPLCIEYEFEAKRVLRLSHKKWIPAVVGGKFVTSYKRVKIDVAMSD